MDKKQAQEIIRETFETFFDREKFTFFIKNLLNHIEDAPFTYQGNYIPDAFARYVSKYERIGKYKDENNRIDILIVYLSKKTSIEHARTMQRNFIAGYLNGKYGSDITKDAALVAFVSPNEEDWRFSLIKMDYRFDEKGKVKEEFTPARRWSFLVGKNEKSHTAQRQLVDRLADDENNPTLVQLEEAFNIEKVTREFFEKYRELFLWTKETLDDVVKKDRKIKADFEAKGVNTVNFAKKLLGQIVFLYFLQKKGWFGVKRDADWGTGPKNFLRELFEGKHGTYKNFFNDILEPLFYDALARDRSDIDHWNDQFKCKIPFLNGGLFDPINNYDWVYTDILLPNDLFSNTHKTKEGDTGNGILDIFDRYNFTVKEDEPLEKEVAVDPEMLGKVFENLLEVKDRKSKGTYYTPREIVHYMCQQSLINYLTTELESKVNKEDIETLIKYGEQVGENEATVEVKGRETDTYSYKLPESIRQNAKLVDEKFANIKVCDPAIGSGAFPVGMMGEIIKARNVLSVYIKNPNRTIYNFKRECIEKSLYGVDIDPSAVEIAKLRLWLSLVVDEEDIKQIKSLPNLDYKIVCGDSLLGVEKNLFNLSLFSGLERLKPLLFNETSPKRKQEYKKQIDEIISQITDGHKEFDFEVYFSEVFHEEKGFDVVIANPPYLGEKGHKDEFQKIQKGNLGKFYQRRMDLFYFFFHLALNLGRQSSNIAFITTNYYITADGARKLRSDLKERASITYMINFNELKIFESAQGQHNMITILQKHNEKHSIAKTCITKREGLATSEILQRILNWKDEETDYCSLKQNDLYESGELYIRAFGNIAENNAKVKILERIDGRNPPLDKFCSIESGIQTSLDKISVKHLQKYPRLPITKGEGVFVLSESEKNRLINDENRYLFYKWYKNSDIVKYHTVKKKGNQEYVIYLKDEHKSIRLDEKLSKHFSKYEVILKDIKKNCFSNKWLRNIVEPWLKRGNYFVLFYPREKYIFLGEKIVCPYRSQINTFAYNNFEWFASIDVTFITYKQHDLDLKYIISILNSKLIGYWLWFKGKRKGNILELYPRPISEIPIKEITAAEQRSFIEIVDKIVSITNNNDYLKNTTKQAKVKEYERQIDQMVYKLYGLTQEEIKIVEDFGRHG